MKPHQWIAELWNNKDVSKPDGRPLYKYRITIEEYLELQKVLNEANHSSHLFAACFAFYAAEWWRRNYDGSHWGWDLLTDSIGITNDLNPIQRGEMVKVGFNYWKRPIFIDRNEHNDFLGTVVIACGLPNYALEGDHYLNKLIENSFVEISQFSLRESESIETIEDIANNIAQYPETLRKHAFYQLINDIVIRLIYLKREHQLGEIDRPIEYLDERVDDWREDFPIQIDSETGRAFLNSLLSNIARIEEANDYKINLTHRLLKTSFEFQIVSFISIPSGFYSLKDLRIDENTFGKFSDKVYVYISSGLTDKKLIGYIFKSRGKVGFQFNGLENIELGNKAFQKSWELILIDSICDKSYPLELPNHEALNEALPWVFTHRNDGWTFKAQSSVSLSVSVARIVFPNESEVQCTNYQALDPLSSSQSIIEVKDTALIINDDNSFRIRIAAEREDNFHFRLLNAQNLPFYKNENKNIFIGLPKLVKIDNKKLTRYYTEGDVEIKLHKQKEWVKPNSEVYGNIKLRCLGKDNEVLFYSKIQVLPEEFQLKLSNGEDGIGEFILHATEEFQVGIKGSEISGEIIRHESGHIVKIITKDEITIESLIVSLQSVELGNIDFKIPFPNDEIKFYDNNGEIIRNNFTLFLNSLHGIRIMLTNLDDVDKFKTVRLELKPIHPDEPDDIIITKSLKIKGGNQLQKSLIDYRIDLDRIFSYSTLLDAEARIIIDNQTLNVKQYAFEADFNRDDLRFTLPIYESQAELVSISGMRLDKEFNSSELIECEYKAEEHFWEIPKDITSGGIWLFFPNKSSKIMFRPFLDSYTEQIDDEESIKQICQAALFKPEVSRIALLEELFENTSLQFDHTIWVELNNLFTDTSHLPLVTFNVWTALSKSQKGLITSYILLNSTIIEQLSNEFQINWTSIPISLWIETFFAYREHLLTKAYGEEAVVIIINSKLDALANQLNLNFTADYISNHINESEETSIVLPEMFLKAHIPSLVNGLRTRHPNENDRWPDYLQRIIIRKYHELPENVKGLIPSNLRAYTKSVIYLPIILAVKSLIPDELDLSEIYDAGRIRVNQVINYDKEWFDTIFNIIQGYYFSSLNN